MAANLQIGYPAIPAAATVTANYTTDSRRPLTNLFGGNRFQISQSNAAAAGPHRITFDLGAGGEKAANYLALGRANLLQRDYVTGVTLKGHSSNDYDAATTVYNNSSFDTEALCGPRREDFFATFTASSAYRYWFLQFTSSANTRVPLSKAYFGLSLDLDHDPEQPIEVSRARRGPYAKASELLVSLRIKGVPAAKTRTFLSEVVRVGDARPVFLFTTSYHAPLNGYRILYAVAESPETPPIVSGINEIAADFSEVL